jgi:hypothetical protein
VAELTDTNEKILMKDHDILIALHTQNAELIRRVDLLSTQLSDSQKANYSEFKIVAISQTKLESNIEALFGKAREQDQRMDAMEGKSRNMDIISYILATVAALVAWFK